MPLYPRVKQPALSVIHGRRLTIPAVAFGIGMFDAGADEKTATRCITKLRHALQGYTNPTVEMMEGVAKFLDVPVEELWDEKKRKYAYRHAKGTVP